MSSGSLIAELVPLALVVALSPFAVIPPLLLLLGAARPRATGLAFAAGWFLGLAASVAAFLLLPLALGGTDQRQGVMSARVRLGIGAILLIAGVIRWVTRSRATSSPVWLTGLSKVGPIPGFLLGLVLPQLNPKFLFTDAAAGLTIAAAGLQPLGVCRAVAGFAVLSASTVVVPTAIYATDPQRFDELLLRAKPWIDRRYAAVTAVILVAIGAVVTYQGLRAVL